MRTSEISALAKLLNGNHLSGYLEEDVRRLANNYYGLKILPEIAGEDVLLLGARSGLEILRLVSISPEIKVIVVESNEILASEIKSSLSRRFDFANRVVLCSTLADAHSYIHSGRIGLVRVDLSEFDWAAINNLVTTSKVGHIVGEFDPCDVDPMEVYRICQRQVGSFFWRPIGASVPLAGGNGKTEYEVSVVVPAYKVRSWMDKCIKSIIGQTLDAIEIIIVDDGSPDDTGKRADEWAARYPDKINVIHKVNGGCASARNAGLRAARGEFVAFVDADDWVDARMFEELYRSAILSGVDVSQCGYVEIFEDSGRKEYYPTAWGGGEAFGVCGIVDNPQVYLTVKPTIWRRIYRKDFLIGHGIEFPEHIRRFDDLPFQFEVLSKIKRMSIIPDCFYYYRQERDGQDVAVTDCRLFVHFPIFDWLREKVGIWAGADIEIYMAKCEMNTHLWALSRIDKELAPLYLTHAAHQFIGNRFHLSWYDLIKVGLNGGRHGFLFILKCALFSRFKRPEIAPCE